MLEFIKQKSADVETLSQSFEMKNDDESIK